MDEERRHKLKFLVAMAAFAYAAYRYINILENKEIEKERMETLKRKYERDRSSSSSDEECEPRPKSRYPKQPKLGESTYRQVAISSNSQNKQNLNTSNKDKTSSGFIEGFVSKFTENQFKAAFRVSRNTASRLYTQFQSSPEYKNIFKLSDETQIPAKHYIWMFLWFVGSKCSYLKLSKVFNVQLCKSVYVVDTVLQFFNNCARDFIRFPEQPLEVKDSAEKFQKIANFPEVIACLITTQIQSNVEYQDCSRYTSLQVFCDSKGRFLDVFVDSTNKIHPTELLKKSQINEKLKDICQGRYHMLANEDYFPREWLLTPINKPTATEQVWYNRNHSKTLETVSDTLKMLKKRFQQLTIMHFCSPSKIKKMVIACCVLQNICLEEEDLFVSAEDPLTMFEEEDVSDCESENPEIPTDNEIHLRKTGELKREQIVEELKLQ